MSYVTKKYNNKLPSEWQFSQKRYKKTQNIMYLTAKRLSIFWRRGTKNPGDCPGFGLLFLGGELVQF